MPKNYLALFIIPVLMLSVAVGCDEPFKKAPTEAPKPATEPKSIPAEIKGTIAEFAVLTDDGYLPVEGYCVVVGLGTNGSPEVDPRIKAYIVEYLRKNNFGWTGQGTGDMTTEVFLRDPDHAIVRVRGSVPPGAVKGSTFDLEVNVPPNNQTRSLEGGLLLPTELHRFLNGMPPYGTGTKVLAMGGGSVFVNPFIDYAKDSDAPKLRSGRIIGGGRVEQPSRVLIQLFHSDAGLCSRIVDRINTRFQRTPTVAVGRSQQLIELRVPAEYKDDYGHFANLVMHMPVVGTGSNIGKMAENVAQMMEQPTQRHEDLALIWEAIGQTALPTIRKSYTSANEYASYYSARTGLRLGDAMAFEVVARFAANGSSPLQIPAIRELGLCKDVPRAPVILWNLMDGDSELARLAAYEALRDRGDGSIITLQIDQFQVDLVPSKRDYVVYATQSGQPRIALFGQNMPIQKPLFYNSPDDSITINGNEGEKELKVRRKLPRSGRFSPWLACDYRVASLIVTMGMPPGGEDDGDDKTRGLGLTYGQIVTVLNRMCGDKTIPAKFVLQPLPGLQKIIEGATGGARPDVGGP